MSAQSSVSAKTPAPTPAPSSSTSAAAGGAADEPTATQEAIDKTPEAPEAASTTCFVEPAKVYNSTTGDLYDVSADTIAAINGFEAPSGFQEEGSREQSFLYSLGNYIGGGWQPTRGAAFSLSPLWPTGRAGENAGGELK